jgi:hypothetical protein
MRFRQPRRVLWLMLMDAIEGFRPLHPSARKKNECRAFLGASSIDHKFVIAAAAISQFEDCEDLTQRKPELDHQEILDRRRALIIGAV